MELQTILRNYPRKPEYLIEILSDLDEVKEYHWISQEEMTLIANHLDIRESHICAVMSFYTLLSTKPRGKYVIQVCKDVPCYLSDDFNLLEAVSTELGIAVGQTSRDKLFSLELTACIGCCDEAPAMRINHEIYTNLSKEKVIHILDSYRGGIL